jgi:hypothetical protein
MVCDRSCLIGMLNCLLTAILEQRVKWFRAREDSKRWKEEMELLDAEWERTIRSCERMAEAWRAVADHSASRFGSGAKAYALRQAVMYEGMKVRLQVSEKVRIASLCARVSLNNCQWQCVTRLNNAESTRISSAITLAVSPST